MTPRDLPATDDVDSGAAPSTGIDRSSTLGVLLDTAAQGIVAVDVQGRIVVANRALETMFGWDAGELVGRSIEELVPVGLRHQHACHRAEYFRAPRTRRLGLGQNLVGQRKDGTTFSVEVSLDHVATDNGGQAIAFVTDISERVRADAELREAHRRLEQRNHQLSRLASDLTLSEQHARELLAKTLHDGLQQLLFSVRLRLAGLVLPNDRAAKSVAVALDSLDEAISTARSLATELFPPMLHDRGLSAALTWLAGWVRTKYDLMVEVTADAAADPVRKDVRILLFESVRELLFNVVKHAAGADTRVDLAVHGPDDLCITVSDRGPGIDPALAFGTASEPHVGLGLFSIRERLTLLGGRLEVDSGPDGGARFRLIAPRTECERGVTLDFDANNSPGVASFGGVSTRPVTVLVVDDHAAVREGMREMLGHHPGIRVIGEAVNGRHAIAQTRLLRPDVVVIDVSMPEMDGVEATRNIHAEFPSIQIFGLSTHESLEDLHEIERAGAAGYFAKGVEARRLVDRLLAIRPVR